MKDTSQSRAIEVSADRPLESSTTALLRHVKDACSRLDTAFVVAGATARDIFMWHIHGIRAQRATRDVDVAVCAITWEHHGRLVEALVATGNFTPDPKQQPKLYFKDRDDGLMGELDLVPYGPLESPAGTIAWPPDGESMMGVLGFREAVDSSIAVNIGEGLVVPVVNLPALVLLKLLAWKERRARQNSDAYDLLFIFRNFYDAGNRERIWDVAPDRIEAHGFDLDLAGAAMLGREAKKVALPETREAVHVLLADAETYETLRRDLLARASTLLAGEFADDSDRYLAAFRDGFLAAAGADNANSVA